MNTPNKHFNTAWELLKEFHPTINLQGETLDLSVKPKINKADWSRYIDALYEVIVIGNREKFVTPHLDGRGHVAFIKYKG